MSTELMQQQLARQEFGIDMDVVVDNYSDSPRRVFEVAALIAGLSKRLNEKGFRIEIAYDDALGIPNSILVTAERKFPEDEMNIANNFAIACKELGISGLFEAFY
ncbi:hypothetical protein HYT53_03600 [Candidatus Woesearchaeota archaeon]|nr:hypothetical protein [Candidatus Woesearchaeota archaeon]